MFYSFIIIFSLFRFMGLHNMREKGRGLGREVLFSAGDGRQTHYNNDKKRPGKDMDFSFFSSYL